MASSTEQVEAEYYLMRESNCSAMSNNHSNSPTKSTHTPANLVPIVEKPIPTVRQDIRGIPLHTTVSDSGNSTENVRNREPQLPRQPTEAGAKLDEVRALPDTVCELATRGKQGDGSNPDKPSLEFTGSGWQRESKVCFREQTDAAG